MGVLIKLGTWLFRALGFLALFGGLWGIDKYTGFTDKVAGFVNGLIGFQTVLFRIANNAALYLDSYFSDLLSNSSSSVFQFIAYVISLDVAIDYVSSIADFFLYAVFCGLGGGLVTAAEIALVWYTVKIARNILKSAAAGVYRDGHP